MMAGARWYGRPAAPPQGRCARAALLNGVVLAALAAPVLGLPVAAHAQAALAQAASVAGGAAPEPEPDSETRLDQVVVTAASAGGRLRGLPHGVSVIDATDIAKSGASSVSELLAREANVNLRSFFGNDVRASVDLRGMGATAGSNVLVMVDGVRLNEADLSGAALSTLSLAQIERIEIVRGGGAVRHGDGAVGGVINIITRPARPGRPRANTQVAAGSLGRSHWQARAATSAGPVALGLALSGQDSEGWRENSAWHARDAAGEVRWQPVPGEGTASGSVLGQVLSMAWLSASHHTDRAGLPGPVSAEDFAAGPPATRRASAPHDFSQTTDSRATAGLRADLGSAGEINAQITWRRRSNPFELGTPGLVESQSRDAQLRWELPLDGPGLGHLIALGLQSRRADYLRREGAEGAEATLRHQGSLHDVGAHLEGQAALSPALTLLAGLRADRFTTLEAQDLFSTQVACQFDTIFLPGVGLVQVPRAGSCRSAYVSQGGPRGGTWWSRAAELGLSWQPGRAWTLFASASRHFRNPNVDELAQSAPGLRPQRGHTLEAGARHAAGPRLEGGLTLFAMRTREEIYYGGSPQLNRNHDQATRRHGAELDLRWQVLPALAWRTRAGWVDARFEGEAGRIPLVPHLTLTQDLEWQAAPAHTALFTLRHVGAQRDGNASSTTSYPDLPAYTVCDLAWRLALGGGPGAAGATLARAPAAENAAGGSMTLAISNLFDRRYATVAYSGTYYPMPPRAWRVSLDWRWR